MKLSLIVPCWNEEKTLRVIVERILTLARPDLALEVVIVDDCSRDGSYEIARTLAAEHAEVKLARHPVNRGKGAALRTGFLAATGDFIGIQDADMEYDPEDYLAMLKPLAGGRADVVYGSRYLRQTPRNVLPAWHSGMNKFLTCCSNMFTDLGLTDMESCYKLFRREVMQKIAPRLKEDRFGFEPEVAVRIAAAHCRVYECAIHYRPRGYGEGKKIGWRDGVRALYCIARYGAPIAPLPTQILLYLLLSGIAAACGIACGVIAALFPAAGLRGRTVELSCLVFVLLSFIFCYLPLLRYHSRGHGVIGGLLYVTALAAMGGADVFLSRRVLASAASYMTGNHPPGVWLLPAAGCAVRLFSLLLAILGTYVLWRLLLTILPKPHKHPEAFP